MNYSKSLALIGLTLAAPVATNAFALISPSTAFSRPHSALGATRDPNNERVTSPDAIRNLAAVSALTLGLLFPSAALAAQDTVQLHALHSSTVELSTTIRTMDFSMPSSYESIVDPVSSKKEELTENTVINGSSSKSSSKKSAAPSEKKICKGGEEKVSSSSTIRDICERGGRDREGG
mmetsp:Transcript_13617/g.29632  ORF Transcript_13617/g.29632 Transcript_13617/m.29632 type:complete len:178 (-) Transcript_13617:199-732(-)